ncbi:MAG: ATP-binding protein [Burkholderiales bacterium]|jgi:signal transduction histidine kinase
MDLSFWQRPKPRRYLIWGLVSYFLALGLIGLMLWGSERGDRAMRHNQELIAANSAVSTSLKLGAWYAHLVQCGYGDKPAQLALRATTQEIASGLENAQAAGLLGGNQSGNSLARAMRTLASSLGDPATLAEEACALTLTEVSGEVRLKLEEGRVTGAKLDSLRELSIRAADVPHVTRWLLGIALVLICTLLLTFYLTIVWRIARAEGIRRESDETRLASEANRHRAEQLLAEKTQALDAARAAEQEAQQAVARAERAERDKRTFLGMASHEIRNPLHALMAAISTLKTRKVVNVDDDTFKRLERSTEDLDAQVADLIDFAELTSERMTIKSRSFPMNQVVSYILEAFAEEADTKNLHVEWAPQPELEERIESDPKRLRQILSNLYSNAIKYTAKGGIQVEVLLNAERSELLIAVEDTGSGIPEDKLKLIFEPYVRVTQADLEVKGHGLGLAVVDKLVHAMDGKISVRSTVGEGTRFEVRIPVNRRAPSTNSQLLTSGSRRILFVEDNEAVLVEIRDQLEAMGWTVTTALRVHQALSMLERAQFDALILDLQLPDGLGVEVAKKAQQLVPPPRLLLLSANSATLGQSDRAMFHEILSKPSTAAEINRALLGASA